MDMRKSILQFANEFAWEPPPRSDFASELRRGKPVVVAGMGGSPLAADLLNAIDPTLNITVHKNYDVPLGFPLILRGIEGVMFIAISYSGNTEETLDAFAKAGEMGLARAAIAKGGKLIAMAREAGAPFVQLPDTDIQPRMATGFIIKALAALMGLEAFAKELAALADILKPAELEEPGRMLAERVRDRVPLIYASTRDRAIAYSWKIKFNETAKIPAFYNVFPELNHNEMNALSSQFYTIILRDPDDDPHIKKRMEALAELYRDKKISIEIIDLAGKTFLERMFSSLLLADWTALALAESRGIEPSEVPIVEEFKKRIANDA